MKRALVIAYYFPPMGMGGVQRTAKFVKYMPLYGWKPHVLTISPKQYLAKDKCLLEELDNGSTRIFRTGILGDSENGDTRTKVVEFKTDNRRKFLSNFSQVFLIPDSKVLWKRKAVELGKKIISENNIDLIFATAPPYTDFLIAVELKKIFGLPLVLDYRDSWIDCPNNFYATPFHKRAHSKMETRVLEAADKVVTINNRIKELIIEKNPFKKEEDIVIIPQGFDPNDFEPAVSAEQHSKMRFTYAGSFMNYYTPKYFFEALSILFKSRPELKDKLEALFIGAFPNEYKKYIDEYGLNKVVNLTGYLEHSECVKYELESDVLWMMINKTGRSDLHSTGKLYEYFGAGKPILACVPEGVAKESLANYNAVKICEPDDPEAIAKAIADFYEIFSSGKMPVPNRAVIEKYDRKRLTGELCGVFDEVEAAAQKSRKDKEHLAHT